MKRLFALLILMGALALWNACAKESGDDSGTSENTDGTATDGGTTADHDERLDSEDPNVRHAAAREAVAAQDKRRRQLITAFADPESKIYKNAADHRAELKKLAANDPIRFHRILANVNSLRDIQGKSRISGEQLTASAGLRLTQVAPEEKAAIIAKSDEKLGACLAAKIGPKKLAAGPAEPADFVDPADLDPADLPGWAENHCPDRCVCAAAHAWAEAYAYASCSDGSFGEGYGWGEGWAYAWACLPDDDDDGDACEDPDAPDEPAVEDPCAEVAEEADPFVEIIEENLDCFLDDGGSGSCGLTPDPEPDPDADTDGETTTGADPDLTPTPEPTPAGDGSTTSDPTTTGGDDDPVPAGDDGSEDPVLISP